MLGWQAFCLEENNLYDLAEKTARKVIQCLIFIIEIFLKNVLSEKYIQVFIRICRLREWRDVEISPKEKSSKNLKKKNKKKPTCGFHFYINQEYSNAIVIQVYACNLFI